MSTCTAGDPFQVSALVEYAGGSFDGCYEDTGSTQYDGIFYSLGGIIFRDTSLAPGLPIVFVSGVSEGEPPAGGCLCLSYLSLGSVRFIIKRLVWLSILSESI